MRLRVLASFGILLGVLLVASVVFAAGYPEESPGLGNSTVWVMNVHESLDANVVASFFDRDGFETDSEEATIDYLGNDSFPASSTYLKSGWLGSVAIDSLRPIASIAETVWEDVPTGDYWSAAAFNDSPDGANEIFFPGLIKSASWRPILTIQCLDTQECQLSMTYRTRGGNPVTGSPFEDTIEAFSQETYDLWDASVNPNIPDDLQMVAPWHGSLQVTSSQQIVGVGRLHATPGHASAYNALPATTDTAIFHPGYRRRNSNDWTGASDWSCINVQNINDFSVTVYLSFYQRSGDLALSFTDTIPAYGSHPYNSRYGTDDWPFEDLGTTFNGSAVVTSTQPIVGSGTLTRAPSYGLSAAHYGFSRGYSKLVFPVAYRVKEGSAWRRYTAINIQNVDPNNEITVHLRWMDSDGYVILDFEDETPIPPYADHAYNTRYGDAEVYGDLGENWNGTVVVTTTNPAGIAGVILNTARMADYWHLAEYNGIPVE